MYPQPSPVTRATALAVVIVSIACSSSETANAAKETAAAPQTSASKIDPCAVVTPEEVEAAVGYVRGRLLTVSTPTLEGSKALTRSAMARLP